MIKRLELENFKAFAHANIPLSGYTLLSGMNASGKSTVLQVLAMLRQSQDSLADPDGRGLLLNADLVDLGTIRDVLHEAFVVNDAETDPKISLAVEDDDGIHQWSTTYQIAESDADLLLLDDQAATRGLPSGLSGRGFQYLRADRTLRMAATRQHASDGQQTPRLLPVPRRRREHAEGPGTVRLAVLRSRLQDLRTAAGHHLGVPGARRGHHPGSRATAPGGMARPGLVAGVVPTTAASSSCATRALVAIM